ncbi:MAG TPA: hypothetical protein VF283_09860 [Bryobacteraceae bacterium]
MRFLLRPIYRAFFKKPLRWGMIRLRAFLLADLTARLQAVETLSLQLRDAEANLAGQLHTLRAELIPYLQRAETSLGALDPRIDERFRTLEENNASQWDGIEQLLLAMFRMSPQQASVTNGTALDEPQYSTAIDLNQVHAARSLR